MIRYIASNSKIISFRYKGGRFVKGEIISETDKTYFIRLLTDYIGKNNEWFVGEEKSFNKKEMKHINL